MNIIKILQTEMENEAATTRKMLSRIPNDAYDFKPHEKSMALRNLAAHIAELPTWVAMVLTTTELDFATSPYTPHQYTSTQELLQYFEQCLEQGKQQLAQATEEDLLKIWTLRTGDMIHVSAPVLDHIRMSYCQIVHHRAQLGVYLRLLNVPIPGSYGPSADEQTM